MSEPITLYRTDNGKAETFHAPSYAQSLVDSGEYTDDAAKAKAIATAIEEKAKAEAEKAEKATGTKAKSGKSK